MLQASVAWLLRREYCPLASATPFRTSRDRKTVVNALVERSIIDQCGTITTEDYISWTPLSNNTATQNLSTIGLWINHCLTSVMYLWLSAVPAMLATVLALSIPADVSMSVLPDLTANIVSTRRVLPSYAKAILRAHLIRNYNHLDLSIIQPTGSNITVKTKFGL